MLAVLGDVAMQKLHREPFGALGKPVDERDVLSRRQVGDLVLLDRALQRRMPGSDALALSRELVQFGGVIFLEGVVPRLGVGELGAKAAQLVSEFFNAEGESELRDEKTFTFNVSRCRFVDLLSQVNASHLVPLFCEVDGSFFDGKRRPILLSRKSTLATGGSHCDFVFHSTEDSSKP